MKEGEAGVLLARQRKLLTRAKLSDALQQEQAVKGLVELLAKVGGGGRHSNAGTDAATDLFALLATGRGNDDRTNDDADDDADDGDDTGGALPRGASSASTTTTTTTSSPVTLPTYTVAAGVCQGLERLASRGKVDDVGMLVKRLLATLEDTLLCASFLPQQHQQQHVQDLLALYVATLAKVALERVDQECGQGNADAALVWCEQCPLALALGFNQARMAPLVLQEAALFEAAHLPRYPEMALVALQAPLLVAGLLEARSAESKALVVHELGTMPLDYLPQGTLAALAACYVELLGFLPWPSSCVASPSSGTDAQLVVQLSKLVFHLVCHLEEPTQVQAVGRRLAHFLVTHALAVVVQASTAALPLSLLLPLLGMLERLGEYDALGLMCPDFPLLAYLLTAMGKVGACGRERAALLAVMQAIVRQDAEKARLTPQALRWSLYPLLTLTSVSDAATSLLGLVEKRLAAAAGSSTSSTTTFSDGGGGRGLRQLLAEAPSATFRRSVASLVANLASSAHDPAALWQREWALFLVMGLVFDDAPPVAEAALDLLEKVLAQDKKGFLGARLFSSVLYRLTRCGGMPATTTTAARLQHRLLALLPALGQHGVGAQLVQALLQRVTASPSLAEAKPTPGTGHVKGQVGHCAVSLGSAALALSVSLYRHNSRTLPRLRTLVLAAGADKNQGLLPDEVDEYRLARALAIAEVVREDPEAGSEFVGMLQTYLMDPRLPGVVATAVDCLTYLCTADCLDYLATVRILQKKGRVQHRDHPLVLANLADLFGAGAYIYDCSPLVAGEEEAPESMGELGGDDEERRSKLAERHLANLTDYLWLLAQQPHGTVRRQAYLGLAGYVPALLASEDEEVPQDVHRRVLQALQEEHDLEARSGLDEVLKEIFATETEDSGTWRRTLLASGAATPGSAGAGGDATAATKPSRKTLKALPTTDEVLGLYRRTQPAVPGLAGAALHALGRKRRTPSGGASLLEEFVDVLSDEDGGGRCVLQRLLVPQSFLRFLPALVQQLTAGRPPSLAATLEAVREVEGAIQSVMEQHRQQGRDINNCFLALSALANSLPPQLSHKGADIVTTLRAAVTSEAATGIALDLPTLLVSLGLAGRCLGPSEAEVVGALVQDVFVNHTQAVFAARTDWGWCQWGALVGASVLTDWVRQVYSPDATTFRLLAVVVRACLELLQAQALRSDALAAMLGPSGLFSVENMVPRRASGGGAAVVPWDEIGPVGEAVEFTSSNNNTKLAVLGASWALAMVAPNLAHVGLEQPLLQLYHVLKAAAAHAVPGVSFPLGAVAAVALKADLVTSEEIFTLLQDLIERIREKESGDDEGALLLGVSHLVVSVRGVVTLPSGLVDGLQRRLVKVMKEPGGHEQQALAASLALYTLLAHGGPVVDLMGKGVGAGLGAERTTAAMTVELVNSLRRGLLRSPCQRHRSGAARLLGLLVALKNEEEDEEGDAEGTGDAGHSGNVGHARLDVGSFGLPSEGTLLRLVLTEFVRLAVGEGVGAAGTFVVSTLGALEACRVLKFQHKQMTLGLQNFLKANQGRLKQQGDGGGGGEGGGGEDASQAQALRVVCACIHFAVVMAPRDSAYVTWLYDVTVHAPPAVVDVVLGTLGDLVRLTPTALLGQLLDVLWRKCHDREEEALAKTTRLLAGLAQGVGAKGSGPATAEAAWTFLEKHIFGTSGLCVWWGSWFVDLECWSVCPTVSLLCDVIFVVTFLCLCVSP